LWPITVQVQHQDRAILVASRKGFKSRQFVKIHIRQIRHHYLQLLTLRLIAAQHFLTGQYQS
jgi:hypothetical protein